MHKEAAASTFRNAKAMRHQPTPAERLLWTHLRKRQVEGVKFRRQHPVNRYILDFYSHELRLAIEVDGNYHLEKTQKLYDQDRSEVLSDLGIRVVRFTNAQVREEITKVIEKIRSIINKRRIEIN